MYKCDKKLLNDLAKSRNLSYKTRQGYFNAINVYVSFNKKSLGDLLNEAEREEESGIRWKKRKLKQRLIHFRLYLQEKYLVSTAKVYFQRIISLYNHFEIEIHKLPPLSTKSGNIPKPITFEDLPTKEIIRNAVEIANPIMKAIILFMSSSGCARRETLNLTIQDFIDATQEYHNKNNIKDVLNVLKFKDDLVPIFRVRRQKTNKFYFTFCSPEASKEIVNYLLTQNNLKINDKLFNINLYYLNKYFMEINDELNLGKVGTYNKFRSHMLRKFHASSLYNAENGLSLEEIDALQGRKKDSTHSSYFMENPYNLKKKYIESLDALILLNKF
ncbi:MAG: site-specific integrase [Methanobrevibacter ruminantium]|uniref:site-specific integrase n=1 Tax=Methanobrevibacter ruminantium TaxID=83816 RepID=UPI002D7F9FF1|nr:site-specific integrase [Methanobrevibacter ruminantium]MCI5738113.1 site-specific integrase [Methanobrevibacter ruminantium]